MPIAGGLDTCRKQITFDYPDTHGPAGAGTRPGSGGRAARRGDEPGRRRRVRPAALYQFGHERLQSYLAPGSSNLAKP